MRRKRILFGVVILAAVFLYMGCELLTVGEDTPTNDDMPPPSSLTTVTIAAIEGIELPVVGAIPVKVITETDQYTGTVVWNDNPDTFDPIYFRYTAVITIKPKADYTLEGVPANFFTVAGAESVTNAAGSGIVTAKFPGGTYPDYVITTQPAASTVVTEGSITGSLSVAAEATHNVALDYQWYSNTDNSTTGGSQIYGATGTTYTIPTTLTADGTTAKTYYYFCEVRGVYYGANLIYSNVAAVTVNHPPGIITITKQPESLTVTAGMITEYLTVTAEVTPNTTLNYQWYSNTSDSNTGGTKLDGETNNSFILPSGLTEGKHYYFCEVSAPGSPVPVRSNAATITINVDVGFYINLYAINDVNVIDQTAYVQANTDIPFTPRSAMYTTVEQWYLNGVPVGTSSTYTFNQGAGVYELAVVVTSFTGPAGQKYSGSCRITVR